MSGSDFFNSKEGIMELRKTFNNLIFLSAQPYDGYFQWQLEVIITNFRKFGLSDKMHVVVWILKEDHYEYEHYVKAKPGWDKLQEKYPEVKFFFYENEIPRLDLYISQLRPHILKKHFKKYQEELKDKVFFYHDSDIIFNYLPDFERLLNDDINWQSDTSGYLDYDYLRRKEEEGKIPKDEAVKILADIGGITVEHIKSYAGKTGGAQCILKDIDYTFWEDLERMCVEIRKKFFFGVEGSVNKTYFPNENAGFQSWCADMWALNFALWKRGKVSDVTHELDFSWATDSIETFLKKPIYHNAGATNGSRLFYKGAYISKSPLYTDLPLPAKNTASRQYVLAIKEVAK